MRDALDRYSIDELPKKIYTKELHRLKVFYDHDFAVWQLADIHRQDVRVWINKRLQQNVTGSTVRRKLNILSSVFRVCRQQWQWMLEAHNRMQEVVKPKAPLPRDRRISQHEIEQIVQGLGYDESKAIKTQRQEIAVAFLLAIETAMRQGELWRLDWRNVILDKRTVRLIDTKNGDAREVPLSTRAVELFIKLGQKQSGQVFTHPQQSAGPIFKSVRNMASIVDLRFHDTRHEAITRLAKRLDMLELARMVGHRDLRSLMIYYNATAEELAQKLR